MERSPQLNSSPTRYRWRGPSGEAQPRTATTPVHWNELSPGDLVLVLSGKTSHTGTVDTVSADGEYLWLLLSDGTGRRLFTKTEVHRTYADPIDLAKRSGPDL